MEKANETSFFQKMIFAMYVLKVKFDFSKKSSGLLLLMSSLQPLLFFFELKHTNLTGTLTLSIERSKENRNTYIFELLQILFRPSIKLIFIFGQYAEYAFFVVTTLILIHKIGLIFFTKHYLDKEKSLNLKNQAENSFLSTIFCYFLNFYQQLIGSYLYLEMNFICLKCFSKQSREFENVGVLLVALNISTMLLLVVDSIGTIIINECTITNKVHGLEKLNISIYRYIYNALIIIQQIIVIYFDQLHIEYLLIGISLCQQLILILELFINCNYILSYQTYPLILAISIKLSFCISIFVVSTSDIQLFTFCCFINFSLIMIILLNQNQQIEKEQIVQLFRTKKTNLNFLRYGLIKILNNEIYFQKEDLMIKILIAKWHSSRCKSAQCTFCKHIFISCPETSSGITNEIYKQFILTSISYFLLKPSTNRKRYNQQEYFLTYAYFLYDFGWMIRSIKILDCILSNKLSHQYQNNFEQTVSKFQLQENDIQLNYNDLNPNSILPQLNYIKKVQIKFMIQCGKTSIISSLIGFSLYATQQSMIQEYIEKSLKSESLIQHLERKIMDTLILKLNFYNILKNSSQEYLDDLDFNKQLYLLCEQVYEVNKILKFNFKNTPNQKIHGLYTFFQGEILSNYHKSVQFYKNSKCLEVELNKFQQIINFNINQKNVHYAILELYDDMQNLKLVGHSQNFHDNFGASLKKQKLFEHLLPNCLIPYHNLYVKRFFESGTSKYFNIFQANFIMSNFQNILTAVNMCYTVTNLFKNKNMIFAVFLQEATQDKAYVFVDGNNLKCKFTKNLMIQIGWSMSDIEEEIKIKDLLQIEILQIYPDFLNEIENKEDEIKLNSIIMYFPSLSNYLDQIENNNKQSPERGKQNLRYITVVCDILIKRRQIGDFCYYLLDIVKMAELIKIRKKTTIHKVEQLNQIQENQYLNEEYIVDQQDDSPHIGNLNSVNFINRQQIGSIQNSTKPLLIQVNPMFVNNSPVNNSRRQENINQTEQQLKTQKFNLLQEDFESPSLQSNDNERNSKKQIGIQLKETQTDTDKIHSKYSLINQIISASPSRYQKNFMVLFSVWFSIFITFIVILYNELKNDLDDFLSYGFMTSFYASIMGPHDLYFSMRVAMTTYQQMNREGFLPSSQMKQFIAPIQEIVDLGYIELRDSFYDQLNNQYIQSFLDDSKVIMNFMNKNEQEIYPIEVSFRDALFTILQYQYAAMRTLQRGESNSGKPFQVSVFANQFMLHKECEKLTQSLYDYALTMHNNMIQKLIMLWLIFDVALIIFYMYLQNFQIKFFIQLDKFISLIFLIDNLALNKEVIRYNDLITSIKLNSDVLLNYNPEIQLQQHLNKQVESHENQNQNQKQKQGIQAIIKSRSLIKILNISFLFFLLSIILIFSLIIITSTSLFFSKYEDTLQFYQQVQQMKFRPGNLILYREIFFRWKNFTFLTENNKLELYDLINKAYNSSQNYILTSSTINFDLYLIDQNFIDLYEDINQNNLCNFIDEKFRNSSQIYCQFSFDGSFNNGMISTLNYITNYIKSQQAINNFTRRVEIQYYEAEGSQIISRVFSNLVNQFNTSLLLQFDSMKLFLTVLSFSFIIITIVIQILIFYFYSPYLGRIMKIIKSVVYLIPFESLMKNELLVRQLKELKFKFQ